MWLAIYFWTTLVLGFILAVLSAYALIKHCKGEKLRHPIIVSSLVMMYSAASIVNAFTWRWVVMYLKSDYTQACIKEGKSSGNYYCEHKLLRIWFTRCIATAI